MTYRIMCGTLNSTYLPKSSCFCGVLFVWTLDLGSKTCGWEGLGDKHWRRLSPLQRWQWRRLLCVRRHHSCNPLSFQSSWQHQVCNDHRSRCAPGTSCDLPIHSLSHSTVQGRSSEITCSWHSTVLGTIVWHEHVTLRNFTLSHLLASVDWLTDLQTC